MRRFVAVLLVLTTATVVAALPEGHPPIDEQHGALPDGHPPVVGHGPGLPPGHPVCPAGRQMLERDAQGGVDAGPPIIST
jgi:hypothetical protein